jgi:DNA polymerase
MADSLHLDYETACDVDITKVGLDVYTSHPSCRVLMAAYRINDGSLQHWQAHQRRIPGELKEALEDPAVERWAFNAMFERVVTRRVLKIKTPRRRWRCSMVLAYMHSFSGGLGDVGEQIGLPLDSQKSKDGKRLIRKFSIPQRVTKNQPHEWRNWITDPDDWELFGDYNCQDVITEEAIKRRLIRFPIPTVEWEYYELDQLINDRGIPVDPDFVENVIWMAAQRKAELLSEMRDITGAQNPNSVSQLLPWLSDEGYPYNDLNKLSVEKALKRARKGELYCTAECVRVLELRQWASLTSTSKAVTAKRVVTRDWRARFLFQFDGASRTGRASGREIQSQNMKRTPKVFDAEESDEKLSFVTDLIRSGRYDKFDLLCEPMLALTGCMRGMFRAPEGYAFRTCDFKSVESAGLAWVTRCKQLLSVFANNLDPYKDFGTEFYRKAYEDITSFERQICKPPALGCGYRLGPGRDEDGVKTGLLKYAEDMGVEMTPEESIRAVQVYRNRYPEVVQFWYDCERAIQAVLVNKRPQTVGYIRFEWMKPYLLIRLPSGRFIYYYKPKLELRILVNQQGEEYPRRVFTYMGRNQKTHQWTRLEGHGGVITENIVQALTRDILFVGMKRLHDDGFNIVSHAHDEAMVMQRAGDNYYTLERMGELMKQPILWAPGFPLGASGWEGAFYRK